MIKSSPALLVTALILAAFPALGDHDHTAGSAHDGVHIGRPWAVATPPVAQVGAGYATITNLTDSADRLLGAKTPVAGRVELHQMQTEDGVMTMRALPDGVEITAGGTLELQPGGVHLMFLDLKAPLKANEVFPVTLQFQQAGQITAEFVVRPVNAQHEHRDDAQPAHKH